MSDLRAVISAAILAADENADGNFIDYPEYADVLAGGVMDVIAERFGKKHDHTSDDPWSHGTVWIDGCVKPRKELS